MAIDEHVFKQNLLLTQLYCEQQLLNTDKNYASILRSYNPEVNGESYFRFKLKTYEWENRRTSCYFNAEWTFNPDAGWHKGFIYQFLNELFDHKRKETGNISIDKHDFKGSIVVVDVEISTDDGVSEAESEGLFNYSDHPPTDTWFYLTEGKNGLLVFAWIPDAFSKLTERAIAVNCSDCIHWFADYMPEEYRRLKL